MQEFIGDDFLLQNDTAKLLYTKYADMTKTPVIDYHCHIDPKDIYEDKVFDNITELWLGGDHYKWRQMRSCGVGEKYITGDAPAFEKFMKWAECMPKLIGNPLYIWSHLELKYYFGYRGNLNPNTAKEVWDLTYELLHKPEFSARGLVKKSNVKLICTTDDPIDSLVWHEKIKEDTSFDVQVLPAFRPDKAMNIEKSTFVEYIKKLSEVSEVDITDFVSLRDAISNRMDYYVNHGCKVSDHGLEYVPFVAATEAEANEIMAKALSGKVLSDNDIEKFKTAFMIAMGEECDKRDWVMQLHYGCKRDNNTYMFNQIGPDTGFDCIGEQASAAKLANFLNALAINQKLPKTILYSLNPTDNAAIGTIIGCFQQSPTMNKVQQGSAWWFNDHYEGMREQLKSLAQTSALGNFVGMLTDSRSFVSYTRHDYFRRILCELIGEWVEKGNYPFDEELLSKLVTDISYNNAVKYFGFDLTQI